MIKRYTCREIVTRIHKHYHLYKASCIKNNKSYMDEENYMDMFLIYGQMELYKYMKDKGELKWN